MNAIEENAVRKDYEIISWHRYIDDIFVVTASPLDQIVQRLNTASDHIQFTQEAALDNGLPFLDTYVTYSEVNDTFSTTLYIKPTHSNAILPFHSHVPMQRKIALLKSERCRVLRICQDPVSCHTALTRLKARFLANGYPPHLIARHLVVGKQGRCRNNRARTGDPVYLRFPFINDTFERIVRSEIHKSRLPIQPIFITPPPLALQLRASTPIPCGDGCICGTRALCNKKNIVYQVKCNTCGALYIGETHRTLRCRIKEHLARNSKSNVYWHFLSSHGSQPSLADVSFSIRASGFHTTLHRKAHEMSLITAIKPLINVQCHPR